MKAVDVVFVGVGGYGSYLYRLLKTEVDQALYILKGIIDPYAQRAPQYEDILRDGTPIYDDLESFYKEHSAALAVIASPLPLHKDQVICALEHGSDVLCEKPLTPCVQDMFEIQDVVKRTGRRMGVGFQWCFADTFIELKKDIMTGKLGKAIELKNFISWKRYDDYYKKWWSGRVKDKDGSFILDSVLTNATCHYLQNMLFLLGEKMGESALPEQLVAATYRAKDIESFDTDIVKGKIGDCDIYHYATHSATINTEPKFYYTFENATVDFNMFDDEGRVTARFKDGSVKVYGQPSSDKETACKLEWMLKAANDPNLMIPCTVETAIPQALVCNAIFDQVPIINFPEDLLVREQDPAGTFVRGLYEELYSCFEKSTLPGDCGYAWAVPEEKVGLDGYKAFKGTLFM